MGAPQNLRYRIPLERPALTVRTGVGDSRQQVADESVIIGKLQVVDGYAVSAAVFLAGIQPVAQIGGAILDVPPTLAGAKQALGLLRFRLPLLD